MIYLLLATPLLEDDVVIFGLLMAILGLLFYTSSLRHKFFQRLYTILPPLLLCYFIPGLLNSAGIISGSQSHLYEVSSNYLLPACLVLFTLNLNLRELWVLRKKAGVMFITGTVGILLGGPLALWIVASVAPGSVVSGEGADAAWRGLATLAGSWIGGSGNQAALYRIFEPSPDLYSAVIAVDVFVAYGWMALLLYGAGKVEALNRFFKADNRIVEELTGRMEEVQKGEKKATEARDLFIMLGIAFGTTAIAHLAGGYLAELIAKRAPALASFSLTSKFFWLILLATIMGIALSFTGAKKLEGVGASRLGTVFLYVLIATIGMQMNILAIFTTPGLFFIGIIWMSFHALLLILVGRLIKAPFFFFAVGSMANVGGAASASVTAGAFHPSLVSIGVILAVFGYAIGTYAGYLCGILMQWVSGFM